MTDLALSGLGWVASPIVKKLLVDASEYLGRDMERELEELDSIVLPQFELMIEAAEKSHHRDKLEKWLRKLKVAFYEAEDLLDEHQYNLLKKATKKNDKHTSVLEDAPSSSSSISRFSERLTNFLPHNQKLLGKVKELKSILEEAKTFRELLALPAGSNPMDDTRVVPQTTSLPDSKVFGRDAVRDDIIDLLTQTTSADGLSGMAIVGRGGAGKSTLAQFIYNDDQVAQYFDARMWVCISRKLDVKQHTREIIESATKEECPRMDSLDALQRKLRDILQKSEKVLLILDDVWLEESKNEMEWEKLLAPFVSLQGTSKVLVTSRRKILPSPLHCKVLVLEDLEDAFFLELLNHYAFSGEEIGDSRLRKNLEDITNRIAKRLGQSPLAAKVVGSRLSRKKDITAWRDALKKDNLADVRSALIWSYEKLNPRQQRCFLYCSLFPKGHKYYTNELVELWMAEGFVDSCLLQEKTMEDVGKDYLKEMVFCSFFQPCFIQEVGNKCYTMHDVLHDLAESLSKEDCFRLEDDKVTEIPRNVRHVSVYVNSMVQHKQSICRLHHLHTVICTSELTDEISDIFLQVLQNLKKLRVLYLHSWKGSRLPESIGVLKHLRYLNLNSTISELPGSLCTLYHLEVLRIEWIRIIPQKICNLSKLRGFSGLPQISHIGKLTSIQQLDRFSVRKEKGHDLRQLRNLNELRGRLSIENLENVAGKAEALESMLHKKTCLVSLILSWSLEELLPVEDRLHAEILEGLKPPPQLKELSINGYQSAKFPSWLLEGPYFENLSSLLLTRIRVLNIRTLPCLPEGLTSFTMEKCPLPMFASEDDLEEYDIQNEADLASRLALFHQAELTSDSCNEDPYDRFTDRIKHCLSEEHLSLRGLMPLMDADISQHLRTIDSALARKEELVKANTVMAWLCCHEQRMKLLFGRSLGVPMVLCPALRVLTLSSCNITDGALAVCLACLTSLEKLSLSYIMTITTLPSKEVMQHLTALVNLSIEGCWCLKSLGGLQAATSVTWVSLTCCPTLELAHGAKFMPPSLIHLYVYNCVLGANFFCGDLPDLCKINIGQCRSSASLSMGDLRSQLTLNLRDMPDLCVLQGLPSLRALSLVRVPRLDVECVSRCRPTWSLSLTSSEISTACFQMNLQNFSFLKAATINPFHLKVL